MICEGCRKDIVPCWLVKPVLGKMLCTDCGISAVRDITPTCHYHAVCVACGKAERTSSPWPAEEGEELEACSYVCFSCEQEREGAEEIRLNTCSECGCYSPLLYRGECEACQDAADAAVERAEQRDLDRWNEEPAEWHQPVGFESHVLTWEDETTEGQEHRWAAEEAENRRFSYEEMVRGRER